MLEAKIVQVELRDGFQSGIDWSALKNGGNSTGAFGVASGNASSNTLISGVQSNLPGFAAGAVSLLADGVALPAAGTGLFGLAFATEGFQAVLGFWRLAVMCRYCQARALPRSTTRKPC